MLIDQGPRQTGRTTKLLLSVAQNLVLGKRVIIVVPYAAMQRDILDRIHLLFGALGIRLRESYRGSIECDISSGSLVICTDTVAVIERAVRGRTFDAYHCDAGALSREELEALLPSIADCSHFETEYHEEVTEPDEPHDAPRRTLSSR